MTADESKRVQTALEYVYEQAHSEGYGLGFENGTKSATAEIDAKRIRENTAKERAKNFIKMHNLGPSEPG